MYSATLPERLEVQHAPQVRTALLGAGDYINGLNRVDAEKRDASWRADMKSAVDFINGYDAVLTSLERQVAHGGPAATAPLSNPQARTLGNLVSANEAIQALAGEHGAANARHAAVEIRGSLFAHNEAFRTTIVSTEDLTGGAGALLPQGQPIPPNPRQRRLFVRDLLNVQETGLASIPYVREYTPTTTEIGASSVAEGIAKPEVAMLFEADDAPVRKVAGWVPVTTEIIEDAPTLRGYIDGRLAYMVAIREEQQVLSGSGATPQLKGILNYSGLLTQSYVSGDPSASLGLAIGKVENVDGEVDGIVMHPTNFWTMVTTRYANQYDGGFGAGLPFASPGGGIWGLPVVRSRAIATGKALVAAWRLGATLFDRMETTVRVGNQHSDFFTTNKVAILAEERVALAVHRPDFFCYTDVA